MEVKKGYKQTEIGVIPEDWDVLNLGKSSVLKARIGWQGLTTAEYLKSGDYYLITGTDFKEGYIDWDNCVYVEKERYIQDKNIQIKEDDILVTKDGTIGKVAFIDKVPKETTLNSGVFVVRPINKVYNQRYLYYVLMSEHFKDFLNRLTAGSTISHLYQKDFVFFDFPKPSLKEQTAIANALSDTDTWINSLEQLLTKKRQIKQGAMQELLQPKEGWEVKKFNEIFMKFASKSFQINSSDYSNIGKYPIVDQGKKEIVGFCDFEEKVFKCDKKGIIIFGDHTRIFKYINFDFVVGADGTQLLSSQKNYNLKFLFFLFLMKEIPNTGYNRHFKFLLEMNFKLPKLEEQTRIATILSDMDKEIAQLETKLAKAKQIKQGMMQELLTGRIRLV